MQAHDPEIIGDEALVVVVITNYQVQWVVSDQGGFHRSAVSKVRVAGHPSCSVGLH